MLIEFVGVPGSGKSYLAQHLGQKLFGNVRVVGHDQSESISWIEFLKLIFRLDIFFHLILFYFSFSNRPKGTFRRLIKAPKFSCFKMSTNEILIRDQGLIQWLWSTLIGVESYSQKQLQKILELLHDENTVLIFVSVDDQVGFQRLINRGKSYSRFDNLPIEELEIIAKKEWPRLMAICELAVKEFIVFDNTHSDEGSIDELARKVVP